MKTDIELHGNQIPAMEPRRRPIRQPRHFELTKLVPIEAVAADRELAGNRPKDNP